ncbi:HAD family hydrolase [Risungbinella massiliensis]|uniref:HAD family hydrolase n=1 Tax=Risungbinella massiliensis TaxID=1329796 RepID=UPI00069C26E4|nr:HAD family hydrolase [Risungbinella massiliensis]
MIKAVLFDLDGTLLPMDTHQFVGAYIQKLAPSLAHLMEPKEFTTHLMAATEDMIRNQEAERTNEEVFVDSFCKRVGVRKEEVWPIFDDFYEKTFPKLMEHTQPGEIAKKVVQAALDQGYQVVVATNPVFPKVAIMERMRWAGVSNLPISFVTVYEETHFCKPNPSYYREIATKLGIEPEECLMVGNDMQEDMVSSTTGMKTYYLKECRIDRGKPQYQVDQEGTMEQLLDQIQNRVGLFARSAQISS